MPELTLVEAINDAFHVELGRDPNAVSYTHLTLPTN